MLSFGDDEEADAGAPVLKKAKFNPKLVDSTSTRIDGDSVHPKRSQPSSKRTRPKSPSPAVASPERPPPELQLPIRNEETPSRSPSSSSEPEQVKKMSTLLDKTNAQIAELKQSMKRNVPQKDQFEAKPKSALEQMIPASATKGRKRKHGNGAQNSGESRALDMLSAFQAKLEQGSGKVSDGKRSQPATKDGSRDREDESVPDDEAELCDLHFIANCESCMSWDDRVAKNLDGGSDDDSGWLNHTLVFQRDRFGKDLSWKENHEDDLVVIDPREKAKDIKAEQNAKKSSKRSNHTIANIGRNKEKRRAEDQK